MHADLLIGLPVKIYSFSRAIHLRGTHAKIDFFMRSSYGTVHENEERFSHTRPFMVCLQYKWVPVLENYFL